MGKPRIEEPDDDYKSKPSYPKSRPPNKRMNSVYNDGNYEVSLSDSKLKHVEFNTPVGKFNLRGKGSAESLKDWANAQYNNNSNAIGAALATLGIAGIVGLGIYAWKKYKNWRDSKNKQNNQNTSMNNDNRMSDYGSDRANINNIPGVQEELY